MGNEGYDNPDHRSNEKAQVKVTLISQEIIDVG